MRRLSEHLELPGMAGDVPRHPHDRRRKCELNAFM